MICARCHHFAAAPGATLCHRCLGDSPEPAPVFGSTPGQWLRSPVGLGWAAVVLLGVVVAADRFPGWAVVRQYDATRPRADRLTRAAPVPRAGGGRGGRGGGAPPRGPPPPAAARGRGRGGTTGADTRCHR
ncbi:hypothetical protein ACFV23_38980, partial [Streptomyces sp. NPDC059627]